MELPDWLAKKRSPASEAKPTKAGPPPKFLVRTLSEVLSFVRDTLFNRSISGRPGFLQRTRPEFKISFTIAALVALSFVRSPLLMSLFLALGLIMAAISLVPMKKLLSRVLPIALITLIIAAPSSLNVIVRGETVVTIFRLGEEIRLGPLLIPREIAITDNGILSAIGLVIRVTASVTLVFAQTMTTRPETLVGVSNYFLRGALGGVLSVSYRYIFLLIGRLEEFIMAYTSRSIARRGERRWAASRIAALFGISFRLSRELEMALESRGHTHDKK